MLEKDSNYNTFLCYNTCIHDGIELNLFENQTSDAHPHIDTCHCFQIVERYVTPACSEMTSHHGKCITVSLRFGGISQCKKVDQKTKEDGLDQTNHFLIIEER